MKMKFLIFFATAEGYVNVLTKGNKTAYNYVYNYTDHLGNIRLSYTESPEGEVEVLEENHYYPFGLKHQKYGSTRKNLVKVEEGEDYYVGIEIVPPGVRKTYQYKYNGKEFQDELGLNFYDYGARNYDPAIGRWMNVDPLAEKYPNISPYAYVANNPIIYIDPDGREIRIMGSDGVETTYTQGMKYEGDDKFTATMVNNLNRMNDIEIGSSVLGDLAGSKNIFQITNETPGENAGASFQESTNGGGKISIGNNSDIGSLAHELFHGYQHEKGQGGASIFNEVEANLFGTAISMIDSFNNSGIGSSSSFLVSGNPNTEKGKLYEQSVSNLLFNNDFSEKDFNNVLNLFKSESNSNSEGIYNKSYYLDRRDNQKEYLIKSFYPLIR